MTKFMEGRKFYKNRIYYICIILIFAILSVTACKKKNDSNEDGSINVNNEDQNEADYTADDVNNQENADTDEEAEDSDDEEDGIYYDDAAGVMFYEEFIYEIDEELSEAVLIDYDMIENDEYIIPGELLYNGKSYKVVGIDDMALYGAEFTKVTLPDTVTFINEGAFYYCEFLTSITIPSITRIEPWTFYGCLSLSSITLPEGIEFIGQEAFYGCESLTSIKLPDSVIEMEDYIFGDCYSLREVKLPKGIERLPDYMFSYCELLEKIELPEGLMVIGTGVFEECISLKELNLPESLIEIEYDAFYYSGLTRIKLPRNFETEDSSMFSYCEDFEYVEVPEDKYGYYIELFEYEEFDIRYY